MHHVNPDVDFGRNFKYVLQIFPVELLILLSQLSKELGMTPGDVAKR